LEKQRQEKVEEVKEEKKKFEVTSNFYGDSEKDYQGRSWLLPDSHLREVF
jgi:hypothetical protein